LESDDEEVDVRVIIVGAGAIGRVLAENLTQRPDNEVVLIDTDKERCEEVSGQLDALVLHGDGTHPEILEKARVREADALVATPGSEALHAKKSGHADESLRRSPPPATSRRRSTARVRSICPSSRRAVCSWRSC